MRGVIPFLTGFGALILMGGASALERPWPHLLNMNGGSECIYSDVCRREDWDLFLRSLGVTDLAAPPDGRAYRWTWINEIAPAYVEMVVERDGTGRLRSNLRKSPKPVSVADVARFEAALTRSTFASLPAQDPHARGWLDYPPEQLMETVVEGRYRFVHRIGGVPEDVRQAGVILEQLAGISPPKPRPAAQHGQGGRRR
jgi:hypothetical protein